MKTAVTLASPALSGRFPGPDLVEVDLRARAQAFLSLTKPRIAVMVLITVAIGYALGSIGPISVARLLLTVLGTGLVAGGASVWNQVLERDRDGRMKRTAARPLPTGRVSLMEAVVFGTLLGLVGLVLLVSRVNSLSAALAATTFVLYVGIYTPLKPITTLNTALGAIPGALPPMIGWAASHGRVGLESWSLFLILFLWQFPHFLAIAWIYREDYARGGHKMLPNVDPEGLMTGRQAMWYAALLVPVGLMPAVLGLGGRAYFLGALALGGFYLYHAVRFWLDVNDRTARKLLRASIVYLPLILLLLLLNPSL